MALLPPPVVVVLVPVEMVAMQHGDRPHHYDHNPHPVVYRRLTEIDRLIGVILLCWYGLDRMEVVLLR